MDITNCNIIEVDKLSKEADVLGDVQKIQDDLKQIFHDEGVHSSSIQLEFSYFGASGCTDKVNNILRISTNLTNDEKMVFFTFGELPKDDTSTVVFCL